MKKSKVLSLALALLIALWGLIPNLGYIRVNAEEVMLDVASGELAEFSRNSYEWTGDTVSFEEGSEPENFTANVHLGSANASWACQARIIRMEIEKGQEYLYRAKVSSDIDRIITLHVDGKYLDDGQSIDQNIQLMAGTETQVQMTIPAIQKDFAGLGEAFEIQYFLGCGSGEDNLVGSDNRITVVNLSTGQSDDNQGDNPIDNPGEDPEENGEFSDVNISNPTGKQVEFSWARVPGATSYSIKRASGRLSAFETVASSVSDTSWTDESIGDNDSVFNYYYKIVSDFRDGSSIESKVLSMDQKVFGDNVYFYSQTDSTEKINTEVASVYQSMAAMSQVEFADDRYALAFKPGDYNIDTLNVGFYTQVLGLGQTPYDTSINNIKVDSSSNGNALCNFWRGIENISIDAGNKDTMVMYAASQAAPLRRLYVNGNLHFDDWGKEASGGFLADSLVSGKTGSWSQQQYFVRNSNLTEGWYDGVWNMVFAGVENAPADSEQWGNLTYAGYTNVDRAPVTREKPFLYADANGDYWVFVPGMRENSKGISWSNDSMGQGYSLPLSDFYVARPDKDDADSINGALNAGKNLILTPGVYDLDKAIEVSRANTVVLGLGLATIRVNNTDCGMKTEDVDGLVIAGLLFDAGSVESNALLIVGQEKSDISHGDNPILLADIYTRVGGDAIGKTKSTLVVNANDVIGDDLWIWRADHGSQAGWDKNTAKNGIVINGDRAVMLGLFVEHFQEYQTLWTGDDGRLYFYQSELPYDVPTQADWMSHNGEKNGFSSLKVTDDSKGFEGYGLGVYEVFIHTNDYITLDSAIEVSPSSVITHACIVSLGNNGQISHIVNDQGGSVSSDGNNGPHVTKVGLDEYKLSQEEIEEEEEKIEKEKVYYSDKKGLASWNYGSASNENRNIDLFNNLGVSWFYNWDNSLDVAAEAKAAGIEYVPMIWNGYGVDSETLANIKRGAEEGYYKNLLTFNEPDLSNQANMTVDEAIEKYEIIYNALKDTDIRLGCPVGAAAEDVWVEQFMAKANERGLRVDFLTIHVYQDVTHPQSVSSLAEALDRLYAKYKLPIWITEVGAVDVSTNWWGYSLYSPMSHDASVEYIGELTELLEGLDYVERYAWFVDDSSDRVGTKYTRLIDSDTLELTEEGYAYAKVGKLIEKDSAASPSTLGKQTTNIGIASLDKQVTNTGIASLGKIFDTPNKTDVRKAAPANKKGPAKTNNTNLAADSNETIDDTQDLKNIGEDSQVAMAAQNQTPAVSAKVNYVAIVLIILVMAALAYYYNSRIKNKK
ncbi:MAG: glycoside hydrolase family protein [Pseudobutyrivibrio sp.]|nr:glycoside hydrolase family protein [Pseudobutyrivibrio sp.]